MDPDKAKMFRRDMAENEATNVSDIGFINVLNFC